MFNEIAVATGADLAAVKEELQSNQTKRWEAVGMLKHIFSCVNLPWQLKKNAINFLLCIMEVNASHTCHDEHIDYYIPSLYSSLQVVSCHLSNCLYFNSCLRSLTVETNCPGCANGHYVCCRCSGAEECF